MRLAKFVKPIDYRVVLANLCQMLDLFGAILVPPLMASLILGEFRYSVTFGSVAVGLFLLGRLQRFFDNTATLEVKEALVVTALTYLVFALFGGIIFTPAISYADGLFEAMSGFTTSGLTVVDLPDMPDSLLFFRSYSQWIGGAGIIVLSLIMLVGPGKTAFQLYTSEYGERNLVGDVKATAKIVIRIYLILTLLGFLAYIIAGMGSFDALLHIMSTVSTGGFSPYENSFAHYDSAVINAVAMFFMILGAIGFPTYYLLRHASYKRFFGDLQLRYLLAIVFIGAMIFWGAWHWQWDQLKASVFHSTTALTGSGFFVVETGMFPPEVKLLTIVLMIFGGSAGSTVGGVKLFRVIIILKLAARAVMRALLPQESKMPIKYEDRVISDHEVKNIFSFLALYLMIFLVSAVLLVFSGFAISDALFESASALGTVGLTAGITSPQLPVWVKLLLTLEMWAGRLEILPVLVVLHPRLWWKTGRQP